MRSLRHALTAILVAVFGMFLLLGVTPASTASDGVISTVAGTGTPGFSADSGPATSARVAAALRSAPMMFVENVGQFDPRARFEVRGAGGTLWLAADAFWLTVLERKNLTPGLAATPSRRAERGLGGEVQPLSSASDGGARQGPTLTPGPSPSKGEGRDGPASPLALRDRGLRGEGTSQPGVNLRLSYSGANPHPRIEPFNRLDTVVSYFMGNDEAKWRPSVPVWGGVRYVDLYPRIDLEITSEHGRLAQRLVVRDTRAGGDRAGVRDSRRSPVPDPVLSGDGNVGVGPRANPPGTPTQGDHRGSPLQDVRLRVEGADAVAADGDALRLTTAVGDVTLPLLAVVAADGTPLAAGEGIARVAMAGGSGSPLTPALSPEGRGSAFLRSPSQGERPGVRVAPGAPAAAGTEVLWPFATGAAPPATARNVPAQSGAADLLYSTFLGGSGQDRGYGIAVDGAGNAYVTGSTLSTDFPATAGAFHQTYNGAWDAFVAKLNASGSALIYATFLGGSANDEGQGIAVDAAGNAYVTGGTFSSNFPATAGAFDQTYNGVWDAFVAKLNASGSALSYATFLGGSGNDLGQDIAVDATGNAYVTGQTYSSNFPATAGAFDQTHNGSSDAFVTKLNATGSALAYASFLGGSSTDVGYGIAVDAAGSAYVTGTMGSDDFPATAGAFDQTHNGGFYDAFAAKLNASGSALAYATFLGGSGSDWGNGIAVDAAGSAYVTGYTASTDFLTTAGAFDQTYNGGYDAFVAKLNASGSALSYATFLGGSANDLGIAIAADAAGNAYVTGQTYSSNFPATAGAFDQSYNGGFYDAFAAKLNASGSALSYATFLGGSANEQGQGIAVDAAGNAYVTGYTVSSNFPATAGAFDQTYNGGDAFVAKLALGALPDSTPPTTTATLSPQPNAAGWNNADVTVTLSATDNEGGSGVKEIVYSASGAQPIASTTVSGGSATVGIAAEGETTIGFYARDNAGNAEVPQIVTVRLDKTPPTIVGTRNPEPNAAGWNNTEVAVSFTCFDGVSGMASCSVATMVSGEGANQSLTGTATDQAGNSASATVSGISIDKTPPTIVGARSPGANPAGWNNGDVTVSFACGDALSGVASCLGATTLTGDGAGQSATGTATDQAGNAATATVTGISIDKTAPTVAFGAPSPGPNAAGWNNTDVSIPFTANDSLSGLASTTPATSPLVLTAEGAAVAGAVVVTDKAGNSATFTSPAVKIDKTAPSIVGSRTPGPNAYGWNNTDVTVGFTCGDEVSGVATCAGGATAGAEGANQSVTGTATDQAGNTASATVTGISIDKTPPMITGSRTLGPNAAGWNNTDVTVSFTCGDTGSGVASCSGATTVSGEGANQSVSGTATDQAGNAATATVTGISIDKTAPSVVGARSPGANPAGWNNSDVTVSFTCGDGLSGVASCPGPTTLTTEGANQSVSGTATDAAGNAATATVSGISIDKTPPTITGSRTPGPNAQGWNNTDVTVSFACGDGLSGVASCPGPTPLTTEGANQSVAGTATDQAGNSATATVSGISIDKTPPSIVGARSPGANPAGWNNGDVAVSFTCGDGLSGVATCTGGTTVTAEGANQSVSGTATDQAGNAASATVTGISIDKTAPSIVGSRTPGPNAAGWNNGDVTVSFACGDELSGVATCTGGTTLTGEGAGQSVAGTATDQAGNSASATVTGINIDKTAPTIVGARSPGANPAGWTNSDVTVSFTCSDGLSGVDTCGPTPQVVTTEGAGQSRTATAVDRAGNSASATVGDINIDKTVPTVSLGLAPAPGADGWIDSDGAPVTGTWSGSDGLSGIASCDPAVVLPSGGIHTVTGTCTDRAGNRASRTSTVKIVVKVPVDIKPGSFPNSINLRSRGNIPVGVKSGATHGVAFDARTIVRSSLRFADAPALSSGGSPEDFDGDGDLDVVFHFQTQDTSLAASSTQACLTGETTAGVRFKGCDSVRVVP